jgi:hydrogenase maturation protease
MSAEPQKSAARLLVIGYGNTLRSDDGVGPRVASEVEKLGLPGVSTMICDLLTPELADPISNADTVVFVDAAVDAPREVLLRPLAPADSSQIMAHAADPGTMLALARDVFGHAPRAWWLTIPIQNIAIGDQFSAFAERGLAVALEKIKVLVQEYRLNRR